MEDFSAPCFCPVHLNNAYSNCPTSIQPNSLSISDTSGCIGPDVTRLGAFPGDAGQYESCFTPSVPMLKNLCHSEGFSSYTCSWEHNVEKFWQGAYSPHPLMDVPVHNYHNNDFRAIDGQHDTPSRSSTPISPEPSLKKDVRTGFEVDITRAPG